MEGDYITICCRANQELISTEAPLTTSSAVLIRLHLDSESSSKTPRRTEIPYTPVATIKHIRHVGSQLQIWYNNVAFIWNKIRSFVFTHMVEKKTHTTGNIAWTTTRRTSSISKTEVVVKTTSIPSTSSRRSRSNSICSSSFGRGSDIIKRAVSSWVVLLSAEYKDILLNDSLMPNVCDGTIFRVLSQLVLPWVIITRYVTKRSVTTQSIQLPIAQSVPLKPARQMQVKFVPVTLHPAPL